MHCAKHFGLTKENGAAKGLKMERVMGIEPTLFAWEAKVLPLNYTRHLYPVDFPKKNALNACFLLKKSSWHAYILTQPNPMKPACTSVFSIGFSIGFEGNLYRGVRRG